MANDGKAKIVLDGDASGFARMISKADRDLTGLGNNVRNMVSRSNGLLATLGVTLGVGTFAALIKSSIDAADHLNDLSKKTGLSVESIGGLGFAAGQSGSDIDAMTSAIGKLNKNIGEASGNKELAADFRALGVDIDALKGKADPAEAALIAIADTLAKSNNPTAEAARLSRVLGKSYQDLMPLLKDGGTELRNNIEFYKQNSKATAELAQRADEYNDLLGKLKVQSQGFGNSLALDMLPGLTKITSAMSDAYREGGLLHALFIGMGGIASNVFTDFDLEGAQKIRKEIQGLNHEIEGLQNMQSGGLGTKIWEGLTTKGIGTVRFDQIPQELSKRNAKVADLQKQLDELLKLKTPPKPDRTQNLKDLPLDSGKPKKDINEGQRAADALLKTYQDQINKLNELSESDKLRIALGETLAGTYDKQFQGASKASIEALKTNAAAVDLGRLIEDMDKSLVNTSDKLLKAALEPIDEFFKTIEQADKRVQSIVAQTDLGKAAEAASDIEMLNDALRRGTIDAQQFEQAILLVKTRSGEAAHAASDFWVEAAKNMQDAMAEGFFDLMQGDFDDLGKNFKRTIDRMVADALAAQLNTALFGDVGKTGKIGGFVGDLFGGGKTSSSGGSDAGAGNFLSTAFDWGKKLFGFAEGGNPAPGWFLAGEEGPELIRTRGGARVYNNRDTQKMMGGGSNHYNTINIQMPGNVDRKTASQTGAEIARQLAIYGARNN